MHKFWLIFTVAAQFFFLINLIPLLPGTVTTFLAIGWISGPVESFPRSGGSLDFTAIPCRNP